MNKATITFTLETDADKHDEEMLIDETKKIYNLIIKQFKDNKYDIMKMAVGIHRATSRLHTHINLYMEYANKSVKKETFSKNLHKMLKERDKDYDLKISIYYPEDPQFNETIGISYAFKEYENFEQIILKELFIGINDDEIEELRRIGNELYVKKMADREREQKRKQVEEDETQLLFKFIYDKINPTQSKGKIDFLETSVYENDTLPDLKERFKTVKYYVLLYYRERALKHGKLNFKAYSIRDKAVAFMTMYLDISLLSEFSDLI